jgi:hypothetical protein
MPEPFIHVTSGWGRIGSVYWTNSHREPYMDWYRHCRCRSWGGFEINPTPGLCLRGSKIEVEDA